MSIHLHLELQVARRWTSSRFLNGVQYSRPYPVGHEIHNVPASYRLERQQMEFGRAGVIIDDITVCIMDENEIRDRADERLGLRLRIPKRLHCVLSLPEVVAHHPHDFHPRPNEQHQDERQENGEDNIAPVLLRPAFVEKVIEPTGELRMRSAKPCARFEIRDLVATGGFEHSTERLKDFGWPIRFRRNGLQTGQSIIEPFFEKL